MFSTVIPVPILLFCFFYYLLKFPFTRPQAPQFHRLLYTPVLFHLPQLLGLYLITFLKSNIFFFPVLSFRSKAFDLNVWWYILSHCLSLSLASLFFWIVPKCLLFDLFHACFRLCVLFCMCRLSFFSCFLLLLLLARSLYTCFLYNILRPIVFRYLFLLQHVFITFL